MMAEQKLHYELDGKVAVLHMDDGKANAFDHAMIDQVNEALSRAEREAGAVLLMGRNGRMSAGFDLRIMSSGFDAVQSLVTDGAEMLLRIYMFPRPVVAACTGHALALGALLLLASDLRIGARGDFKIGLNEVAIKLTLPVFGMELARARISPLRLTRATTLAEIYDPDGANAVGFLDDVAEPGALRASALAAARRLAELSNPAFHNTKVRERGATVELIRRSLREDIASFAAGGPPRT